MTCLTSLMEETDKENKEEEVKMKKEEKDADEEEGEKKSRKEAHCQKNICSLCKVKILP